MKVLRDFRAGIAALRALAGAIETLARVHIEVAPSTERLDALERSQSLWEAEMEAQQLRSDSTLKSANNAEARARTMERHYDKFADPFADDSEEESSAISRRDGAVSEAEGLQPVHVDVAPNHKARALTLKFG